MLQAFDAFEVGSLFRVLPLAVHNSELAGDRLEERCSAWKQQWLCIFANIHIAMLVS